ncbi:MAG: hypothetical protein IPM82_11110 [Saprospiraceae bacterium]|nr:hypothetical protein [Saprospiraceae bacterium]
MSVENVKLNIIEKLLPLNNLEVLLKIQSLLGKTLHGGVVPANPDDSPKEQTFEEWNLQFEDDENTNLEEYLPEHGMSLRQFRQLIWEGEQSEAMTFEAFWQTSNPGGNKAYYLTSPQL